MCTSPESGEQEGLIGSSQKVSWRMWIGKEQVRVQKLDRIHEAGGVQEVVSR